MSASFALLTCASTRQALLHPWFTRQVGQITSMRTGRAALSWCQAAGAWPLGAYARSAPHPRGTVVAQDFFRSGLLPADTDFRVFEASLLRWQTLRPLCCSGKFTGRV